MKTQNLLLAAALLTLPVGSASAAEVYTNGSLSTNLSARTSSAALKSGEKNNWLLAEEKLQIELTADSADGLSGIYGKFDFVLDSVQDTGNTNSINSNLIDFRELYGEIRRDSYEVRIGRQMITWGVSDRLFINDFFPKNWTAFFAGSPLEYMKTGSDSVKVTQFGNGWDIEWVATPSASFDKTPQADRFLNFAPPGMGSNPVTPDSSADNAELAVRIHVPFGNTDVSIYGFRGFWHQPDKGMQMTSQTTSEVYYPRLNAAGVTVQDSLAGGIASFEFGYYQSEDRDGNDPLMANSQTRYLIGYETDIASDLTLGLQAYGELMANYGDYETNDVPMLTQMGMEPTAEHRQIGTISLRHLAFNQTLTSTFFGMFIKDGGTMLNPQVSYSVSDELSIASGLHIFSGGPANGMLGMMKDNDNLYMNLKWSF